MTLEIFWMERHQDRRKTRVNLDATTHVMFAFMVTWMSKLWMSCFQLSGMWSVVTHKVGLKIHQKSFILFLLVFFFTRDQLTSQGQRQSLQPVGNLSLMWAIDPNQLPPGACCHLHVATYSWASNRVTPFTVRKDRHGQ